MPVAIVLSAVASPRIPDCVLTLVEAKERSSVAVAPPPHLICLARGLTLAVMRPVRIPFVFDFHT